MTQSVQTQELPGFNYASLESSGDYLQELKLEEGKHALVAFLKDIPGMQSPPFVYCKVHWNSEMGENGRLYQCFGGSCCQQVTWQKGWGGEPGKFEVNKARTRYFIPIVHYEQDPQNPASTCATVKYLNLTWSAYDALIKAVQNTTEGLDFFERDITLESQKINGATVYLFHKKESKASWLLNQIFLDQVNKQLPDVARKLLASMPKTFTEEEFLAMKPQLDAKVQQAMATAQAQQAGVQAGFGALPTAEVPPIPQAQPIQAQPVVQPVYTQPQVNIPVQPSVQQVVPETVVTPTVTQPVAQPVAAVQPEQPVAQPVEQTTVPAVNLDFDPNALLK